MAEAISPFAFVNSITDSKEDVMVDDLTEKGYNAWIVNRALSQHADTALMANEMNYHYELPARMQYDFLRHIVRKRKRFGKWPKAETDEAVSLVAEYYGYSKDKARQVVSMFPEVEVEKIRKALSKGGRHR